MSKSYLSQKEADYLFSLEKVAKGNTTYTLPIFGGKITIPLVSSSNNEEFILDVYRSRIELSKNTFQNRGRGVFCLCRIDLKGPGHVNPDGEEIPCNHIHFYTEGFGDRWAYPLPEEFKNLNTSREILDKFMDLCNITGKPLISKELLE